MSGRGIDKRQVYAFKFQHKGREYTARLNLDTAHPELLRMARKAAEHKHRKSVLGSGAFTMTALDS